MRVTMEIGMGRDGAVSIGWEFSSALGTYSSGWHSTVPGPHVKREFLRSAVEFRRELRSER